MRIKMNNNEEAWGKLLNSERRKPESSPKAVDDIRTQIE